MENVLIAARAVHYASTIAIAGGFAFLCLVAGPAIRQATADPAAAERLRRNLTWLNWVSLSLVLISGAAWLLATASTMSGEPLRPLLSHGVLQTVLTQTRFGQIWLLRLVLAALIGCCLLAQHRQRNWVSGIAAWMALVLATPMLAALAWSGHGVATPGLPGDLHLAADILHMLAAGLWIGSLIPFGALLAEAQRIGGTTWTDVARTATRRFSATAVVGVPVLLAAGLVNTWFLAGSVPALIGTEYGRLLLAKIAIFLVMVVVAAVNLFRLTPRLARRTGTAVGVTLRQLQHNAGAEAAGGLAVLAVVAILGTLPPGLHGEPGWPLRFRIDPTQLREGAVAVLAALVLLSAICLVACVILAAAGHYRRARLPLIGLLFCLGLAWLPLRPAIEPAYPTTFYAPAMPYAAYSVARGRSLYAENCALCHGPGGKGDGPAAAGLPIRPADLTAPHLFAHPLGDLFWWISDGRGNGLMPGFGTAMSPDRRWDVINFIRARAAGLLSKSLGPSVTAGAGYPVPDFAFERDGRQQTLGRLLARGPVVLILFSPPTPTEILTPLAAARRQFTAADLAVVAIDLRDTAAAPAEGDNAPVLVGEIAADVAVTLRLFASELCPCELLLDRAGDVRARWVAGGHGGLAEPAALIAAAARVARFPPAAPGHAGHTE